MNIPFGAKAAIGATIATSAFGVANYFLGPEVTLAVVIVWAVAFVTISFFFDEL